MTTTIYNESNAAGPGVQMGSGSSYAVVGVALQGDGSKLTAITVNAFLSIGFGGGPCYAELWACTGTPGVNGKPTGVALATSDTHDISESAGGATMVFAFASEPVLSLGTNYCVSIFAFDATLSGDEFNLSTTVTGTWPNANMFANLSHTPGGETTFPSEDLTASIIGTAVALPAPSPTPTFNLLMYAVPGAVAKTTILMRNTGAIVSGVTGTGDLVAQTSSVSGDGISSSTGTGSLLDQSSAINGIGISLSTGTGALLAQASSLSGSGVTLSTGTGTLQAQSSSIAAAGVTSSTGTGALQAQSVTVSGSGVSGSTGTGALQAQSVVVAGSGISGSTGTGSLLDQNASVSGAGVSGSTGTGSLISQAASMSGSDILPVITGSGVLQSQDSVISGDGSISGVVQAPIIQYAAAEKPLPKKRAPLVLVARGKLQADDAQIHGAGVVSWEDHNLKALLLMAA